MNNIVFITAIYTDIKNDSMYKECTHVKKQKLNCDFICFTNKNHIINNGWTIDTTPYHLNNEIYMKYKNSMDRDTRDIIKFYKMQFYKIPLLKKYNIVIWIDSSMQITSDIITIHANNLITKNNLICLQTHEYRNGSLLNEVNACCSFFNKEKLKKQYKYYIKNGYKEEYWTSKTKLYGLWSCGFIIFNMNDEKIYKLLDRWYLHNMKYTNRDQISFPYICYKLKIIPYTFPDNVLKGNAHTINTFYTRTE